MNKDQAFLLHIMDETRFLMSSSRGLDLEGLRGNPVLQRAFLRSLEVIGEAVKNLSPELKEGHPEVDWRRVAGLRDKLIHHYFEVDWDVVWDVVTNRLPDLEGRLRAIMDGMDQRDD